MSAITCVGWCRSGDAERPNGTGTPSSWKRPIIFSTPAMSARPSISASSGLIGEAPSASTCFSSMQAA